MGGAADHVAHLRIVRVLAHAHCDAVPLPLGTTFQNGQVTSLDAGTRGAAVLRDRWFPATMNHDYQRTCHSRDEGPMPVFRPPRLSSAQ
jgi:hypothetical protein